MNRQQDRLLRRIRTSPRAHVRALAAVCARPAASGLFRTLFLLSLLCVSLSLAACTGATRSKSKLPPLQVPPANATDSQICRDLTAFPQDLRVYAQKAGAALPLLSPEAQAEQADKSRMRHFRAWSMTEPSKWVKQSLDKDFNLKPDKGYTDNLRPLAPGEWAALQMNANREAFPARVERGITVRHTDLRAMPTSKPFFLNPDKSGEGYPFDYFQHTSLPVGTPVFICHVSEDGLWVLVETNVSAGWLPAADVASVDDAFVERWQSLPLAALVRDNVTLRAAGTRQDEVTGAPPSVRGHIGTLLPFVSERVPPPPPALPPAQGAPVKKAHPASAAQKFPESAGNAAMSGDNSPVLQEAEAPASPGTPAPGVADVSPALGIDSPAGISAPGDPAPSCVRVIRGPGQIPAGYGLSGPALPQSEAEFTVLYPRRSASGQALAAPAILPVGSAVRVPLPLTPGNVAAVGNCMMGQPYGWGGLFENRDCSALTRDLMAPFGLWLPRNSANQGSWGRPIVLKDMPNEEKEARILAEAVPFFSLVWLRGHIGLYLGEYEGRPAMFHNIWGLRIRGADPASGLVCESRAVIGKAVVTSLSPGAELPGISTPGSILDRIERISVLPEAEEKLPVLAARKVVAVKKIAARPAGKKHAASSKGRKVAPAGRKAAARKR